MENHTAKHFVLQLGSLITLYLSIAFLLVLLFNIINLAYPDAADAYWQIEGYSDAVRIGIAMLIVFFPAYLILTRKVNQIRRQESSDGSYLGFTKWLIYLSLLVGGGVILGDLVAVILGFLNGELTTRFMLKAGLLLVVVGLAFYYYLLDARGYWSANEKKSVTYGMFTALFVFISLIVGFNYIETPEVVREMKLDEKQVTDLQDMQFRIQDYLAANNKLPANLEEAYSGLIVPTAPEDRPAYEYEVTENGFSLCADFAHASQNRDNISYPAEVYDTSVIDMRIKGGSNWDHPAGRHCFPRTISQSSNNTNPGEVPVKVIN